AFIDKLDQFLEYTGSGFLFACQLHQLRNGNPSFWSIVSTDLFCQRVNRVHSHCFWFLVCPPNQPQGLELFVANSHSSPSGLPYFSARSSGMRSERRPTVNPLSRIIEGISWRPLRLKLLTRSLSSNSATRSVIRIYGVGQTLKKSSRVH